MGNKFARSMLANNLYHGIVIGNHLIGGEAAIGQAMGRAGLGHCAYGQFYLGKIAILHRPENIAPVAIKLVYVAVTLTAPVLKFLLCLI